MPPISSSTQETFPGGQPENIDALKQEIQSLRSELSATRGMLEDVSRSDHLRKVSEFHEKFGLVMQANSRPDFLGSVELAEFRANFLQEELTEYCEAHGLEMIIEEDQTRWVIRQVPEGHVIPGLDLEKCLDALIDLEYVLLGTVHLHGFAGIYDQAFDRVQSANMSKVRTERPEDSKRGSGFDVIKPEGWEPPVFADLLDHAQAAE